MLTDASTREVSRFSEERFQVASDKNAPTASVGKSFWETFQVKSECQQEKSQIGEKIPENDPTWVEMSSAEGLHFCWRHSGGSVLRWPGKTFLSTQALDPDRSVPASTTATACTIVASGPAASLAPAFRNAFPKSGSKRVQELSSFPTRGTFNLLHSVRPNVKSPESPLGCCLIAQKQNLRGWTCSSCSLHALQPKQGRFYDWIENSEASRPWIGTPEVSRRFGVKL